MVTISISLVCLSVRQSDLREQLRPLRKDFVRNFIVEFLLNCVEKMQFS